MSQTALYGAFGGLFSQRQEIEHKADNEGNHHDDQGIDQIGGPFGTVEHQNGTQTREGEHIGMNKEIRQLICMIEIASDDIVKDLEINETSVEALRRIKSSVSRMQSAVNSYSVDMQAACEPVLKHILAYVRMASRYGEAIEDYADRITDHVDSYLLLQRPYDTEREQRLDREMETAVELKRCELKLERIAKDMRALIDQKLNGEFPVGSPRYKNIVTRYNDL